MDLNVGTGDAIDGWAEVTQSLLTILSTPIGSRQFRREFGSEVPSLVGSPMNEEGILALYVAAADAIALWEPRFVLTGVSYEGAATGAFEMTLSGNYRPRAHLGDYSSAEDAAREVRIGAIRADEWSVI